MIQKRNFFHRKRDWSKIKDDLLACYLKLYFTKILTNGFPITYIDAFAGQGLFDDGEKGSPLIALDLAEEAIRSSRNQNAEIDCYFIECEVARQLADNVKGRNAFVIEGRFEDKIGEVLQCKQGRNIFLYVDPFGIKSLHFDNFNLLTKGKFVSTELLLNLNSFGFLREGCRLFGYRESEKSLEWFLEGLEEREIAENTNSKNTVQNMNRVANGDYWQTIIEDYYNGLIDAYDAEETFVNEYCKQLEKIFAYVINIPIKAKNLKNMPKYRMIFCSNHKHGFIEMAGNMLRRWYDMQEAERNGQLQLFEMNVDFRGNYIEYDYENMVLTELNESFVSFDDLVCSLLKKYGVLCDISKVKNSIKSLEKAGKIELVRIPAITPSGRKATWIDWKFNKRDKIGLKVRLKK